MYNAYIVVESHALVLSAFSWYTIQLVFKRVVVCMLYVPLPRTSLYRTAFLGTEDTLQLPSSAILSPILYYQPHVRQAIYARTINTHVQAPSVERNIVHTWNESLSLDADSISYSFVRKGAVMRFDLATKEGTTSK